MDQEKTILCGNASDSLYLTFKGGCRKELTYREGYRCTGCGGRFHKDCILHHFKEEAGHDWGRLDELKNLRNTVDHDSGEYWEALLDDRIAHFEQALKKSQTRD